MTTKAPVPLNRRLRRLMPRRLRRRLREIVSAYTAMRDARRLRGLRTLAERAMANKDWNEASRLWRRILVGADAGASTQAVAEAARAARKTGDVKSADALVVVGRLLHPDSSRMEVEAAEVASAAKSWSLAAERWQRLLERNEPGRIPPRFYARAVRALRGLGDFDAADGIAAQGRAIYPDNRRLAIEYAELAHHQKEWAVSLERWRRLIDELGLEMRPRMAARMARAMIGLGLRHECELLLESSLATWPEDRRLRYLHAMTAFVQKQWAESHDRWACVEEAPANGSGIGDVTTLPSTMKLMSKVCLDEESAQAIRETFKVARIETIDIWNRNDHRAKVMRLHRVGDRSDGVQLFEKLVMETPVNVRERMVGEGFAEALAAAGVYTPRYRFSRSYGGVFSMFFDFVDDVALGELADEHVSELIDQLSALAEVEVSPADLAAVRSHDLATPPSTGIQRLQRFAAHGFRDPYARDRLLRSLVARDTPRLTANSEAVQLLREASWSNPGFFETSYMRTSFGLTHFDLHHTNAVFCPSSGRVCIVDLAYADVAPFGFDAALFAVTKGLDLERYENEVMDPLTRSLAPQRRSQHLVGNLYYYYALAALYLRPRWAATVIDSSMMPSIKHFCDQASGGE